MKVTFKKNELIEAITPLMGAVSSKNTIQSVAGILMESDGDRCILYAYDLEKGMRNVVPCRVEEEGSYVLEAQKLLSIVRAMPDEDILLEINPKSNRTVISSGSAVFEMSAINGEDFPDLPVLEGDKGFLIEQSIFRDILMKTMFAVAINDSRICLNGAFFSIHGKNIRVVGCDGNRLAYYETNCELMMTTAAPQIDSEFIVPNRTLGEILKLVGDPDGKIEIQLTNKHILFFRGDFVLFSRLIDQQYVDYSRFIPREHSLFVHLDSAWFAASVERALLVTEDHIKGQLKSPVRLLFRDQTLTVRSSSVKNLIEDTFDVEKEGDDLEIGFNCRLLADVTRAIDFPRAKLSLTSAFASMIIEPETPEENRKLLFLVLPVRLKDKKV